MHPWLPRIVLMLTLAGCRPADSVPSAPPATTTTTTTAVEADAAAPATVEEHAPKTRSPASVIAAIARDLERLKPRCPKLAEFDADKNAHLDGLTISYALHTHAPAHRGGWTSGVPNPDDDGIWFHIDLHDPSSKAQIHTQPVVEMFDVGDKKLMILLLEGSSPPSCGAAIDELVERYAEHRSSTRARGEAP